MSNLLRPVQMENYFVVKRQHLFLKLKVLRHLLNTLVKGLTSGWCAEEQASLTNDAKKSQLQV